MKRVSFHSRDTEDKEVDLNTVTERIIGAEIGLYKVLGPGPMEHGIPRMIP